MNLFRTCTASLYLGSGVRIDVTIHNCDAISVVQNG